MSLFGGCWCWLAVIDRVAGQWGGVDKCSWPVHGRENARERARQRDRESMDPWRTRARHDGQEGKKHAIRGDFTEAKLQGGP
ncbi:hypothetical protein BZA05DRAFT_395147 [Tricharina praecox]|uniref:uncharacterized protein n=1 Tax=Tricharina praecox TaxID=43433 RepID=UPI00221E5AC2|nr:uncharacterized protein BZA05DRAFT_395147 [Tricharina praecox]KAI5853939.1 hypothetical protein BZA05DRAFT_395147 [Tricharina praecox]